MATQDIVVEPGADEDEGEPFPQLDENSPNLALDLEDEPDERVGKILEAVGERVVRDFKSAYDSTEEYRQRCADNWKLFSGDLPKKSHPWENCSNMHVPILLEHGSRISARVLSEVFGDWQNFHSFAPVNAETQSREAGEILTIHSNWQFRTQIRDFPRQMERGMEAFIVFGDVTCHSFYDEGTGLNRHEICTPDDFVIPYTYVTTQPDYSDVPYRCKVLNYYRHQIQAMREAWNDVDAVLDKKASHDDEPEFKLREEIAKVSGQEMPDADEWAPRKLILYEGWSELLEDILPDIGRDRFIQAIVDENTKHVLKLTVHEEDDWKDRQRFEMQEAELHAYEQAMTQRATMIEQATTARTAAIQQIQAGLLAPEALGQIPDPAQAPPAPPPPDWYKPGVSKGPAPVKKTPIHMFTHAVDIENLLGSLGIGHGRILADLNRAANTALNQFIDAASLHNGGAFFTTLDFKTGSIKWGPGVMNKVEGVTPEELDKGLKPMQMPPANPQLLELVDKAREYAEKSMQAGEVLSGVAGKSGETWRGHSARIEQATKQLSAVAGKWKNFVKRIIENNARLNSLFLPEHEIVVVADHLGGSVPIEVGREMYGRNYAVEVLTDLRFATRAQKVSEADDVVAMVAKLPPLQQNPAIVHAALAEAFKARGLHRIAMLLGPEPPPGQAPQPQPQAQPNGGPSAAPPGVAAGPPPRSPGVQPGPAPPQQRQPPPGMARRPMQ